MPVRAKEKQVRRTRLCQPINADVLIVGVDIAKNEHVAVATHADGRLGKPLRFGCDAKAFSSLVEYAEREARRLNCAQWVVALEPTGHYGLSLVAWLAARKIDVYSVQPLHTNRAKELYDGTTRKTDAKDAAVIASLCRQGLARSYRLLKGAFAELRVLAKQRQQLVIRRSQVVNRLHRHVDVVFPELRKIFADLVSGTCLWVLAEMPTPALLLAKDEADLVAGLRKASRGQLGAGRAEELREAARASVGIVEGLAGHRVAIEQLLAELRAVLEQMSAVEAQMAKQLEGVPYAAHLRTIPRLGMITIATLLGEFGDLRDYKVSAQLVKMAGLDLVENSSGERKGQRHISRHGRSYARQILYMAALRVGQSFLSDARRRKVEERKGQPTKAAVANMARLLRTIHAMARDMTAFDLARRSPPAAAAA
jgi:transposase